MDEIIAGIKVVAGECFSQIVWTEPRDTRVCRAPQLPVQVMQTLLGGAGSQAASPGAICLFFKQMAPPAP